MKRLLILPFILWGVTAAGAAFGAENNAENVCDLTNQYRAFQAATQNPSYSSEAIRKELSARIGLLNATIDCANADIDALKASAPEAASDQAKFIRNRLMSSLDEAGSFYKRKKDLAKDQGLQGTKDIAREIRSWRDNNYDNLAARVKSFTVWNDNQTLFEKASERLSQSQFVINSLKFLDGVDSQKLYYDAKVAMDNARELNQKAGEVIAGGLSSEETFSALKNSLNALAATYKKFLSISDKLTRVLPAEESGKQ